MSDTPKTDALLIEINEGRTYKTVGPLAELARDLERALHDSEQARERAEKDARRYRSIREHGIPCAQGDDCGSCSGAELDEQVDAAQTLSPQQANISRNSATNTEPTFTGSEPAVGEGLPDRAKSHFIFVEHLGMRRKMVCVEDYNTLCAYVVAEHERAEKLQQELLVRTDNYEYQRQRAEKAEAALLKYKVSDASQLTDRMLEAAVRKQRELEADLAALKPVVEAAMQWFKTHAANDYHAYCAAFDALKLACAALAKREGGKT